MIKLDLHIRNKTSSDWRSTLLESIEHRETPRGPGAPSRSRVRDLHPAHLRDPGGANRHESSGSPGFVHTDDVREYLLQHPGITPEHIAVKTSSTDDLQGGGRRWRLDVPRLSNPLHHHETSVAGGLGLPVRLRPRHSLESDVEDGDHPTGGPDPACSPTRARRECPCSTRATSSASVGGEAEVLQEVRKGFGLEGLQGLEGRVVSEDNPAALDMTR